jgi:5-methylcytosine-specific restriction endonuclease McrA
MGESTQSKACPKCGLSKTRADFHKDKRRRDGLASWCKECAKRNAKRWRAANVDSVEERRRAKYAAAPEVVRQRSRDWAKNNKVKVQTASRTYYEANRERIQRAVRARVASDPEKYAAIVQASKSKKPDLYRALAAKNSSRRRARVTAAPTVPFTAADLLQRMAYFGNRCWICGGPEQAVDHVKPIFAGGPHTLANLRPVCTPCNSRKAGRWPYPT